MNIRIRNITDIQNLKLDLLSDQYLCDYFGDCESIAGLEYMEALELIGQAGQKIKKAHMMRKKEKNYE
tara:strand:+ start:6673 stop:6876 length:204 start_codon:yes stop_codon:yes gene_type:complete